MKVVRTQLQPGVWLTAVQTKKFKSSVLAVHFLTPLKEDTASLHALVPMVLRRGTTLHPDLEQLSAALDELYGGSLEPMVRKKGEAQCIGFVGSFLDDAYTLKREPVLEPAASLMTELLLQPYTKDGSFCPDYTRQEKANLTDRIRAQVNDKCQYAQLRVVEEMCAGEPFGVDKLGSLTAVEAITPQSLWTAYQSLLTLARVELYYCGSAEPERVEAAFAPLLAGLPRTHCDAWDEGYPALMLANAIYGGTTTSKLFMNVREKLSLCYYASSGLMKYKDVMLVSSGVEFDKVGQAEAEILSQLYRCQTGELSDDELEWARRSVVSTLRTTLDSQGHLEDYWLGQSAAGLTDGPDVLAQQVEAVTRQQVVAAAQDLTVDTVYFLKGRE